MGDKGDFAELKNLKQIYQKEEIQQNTFHLHRKRKRKVFLVLVVIPLGFEPKTHALEGRCSNPTELQDLPFVGAKVRKNVYIANFLRRIKNISFLNPFNALCESTMLR